MRLGRNGNKFKLMTHYLRPACLEGSEQILQDGAKPDASTTRRAGDARVAHE
jgi:hypothetical protein